MVMIFNQILFLFFLLCTMFLSNAFLMIKQNLSVGSKIILSKVQTHILCYVPRFLFTLVHIPYTGLTSFSSLFFYMLVRFET